MKSFGWFIAGTLVASWILDGKMESSEIMPTAAVFGLIAWGLGHVIDVKTGVEKGPHD